MANNIDKNLMKGIEFAEVRDAIMGAFDGDDFDMLLYERLNYERSQNVADGPLKVVVTEVLKDFQRQGLDSLLIAEVAAKRPLKAKIQDIYKKYAAALVDEGRRMHVEGQIAAAVEQYGLLGGIELQKDGVVTWAAKMGTKGALEKAITNLGYIDYHRWLGRMLKFEGQICRVEVDTLYGPEKGTGFLVAADLVLTNYHVIEKALPGPDGRYAVCRFDYTSASPGSNVGTPIVSAKDWLVAYGAYTAKEEAGKPDESTPDESQLDFALIRLAVPVGSQPLYPDRPDSSLRGWIDIPPVPPTIVPDMPLMILQHPKLDADPQSGKTAPLTMAIDPKSVIGLSAGDRRVRYRTNTESGSSGAPCLTFQGELVALHHYGDPGNKTLGILPGYNQGIPISAILQRLKTLGLDHLVSPRSP